MQDNYHRLVFIPFIYLQEYGGLVSKGKTVQYISEKAEIYPKDSSEKAEMLKNPQRPQQTIIYARALKV